MTAFSNTDWAGDSHDHRSTTGLCVFIGYGPVSWHAKKQSTAARSSTEAEYGSLVIYSISELSYHLDLLSGVIIFQQFCRPPILFFHALTKHVEVDYHFIREKVLQKNMEVRYVVTQFQLADIFTKRPSSSSVLISTVQASGH